MSMNMPEEQQREQQEGGMGGWKHWGIMLLCCLPMIALAVLLAAGIWSIR